VEQARGLVFDGQQIPKNLKATQVSPETPSEPIRQVRANACRRQLMNMAETVPLVFKTRRLANPREIRESFQMSRAEEFSGNVSIGNECRELRV